MKSSYNRLMSAMTEDTSAAMLHTFVALTDGAKAIALQSGKLSNLYIRGERKGLAAEEAAKELADRAAACVSRKLRKIDMDCAVAFLAEYISRQRKADEPTNPEPDNTPNVSDHAHAGQCVVELTLTNWVDAAKRITARSAAMKDWRITNKHNRQMREIAREWTAGRGYMISTVKDLRKRFGLLSHYDVNAPGAGIFLWAIDYNSVWKRLQFTPIIEFER